MAQLPNIIVLTTHDTGRYYGCYGKETVSTPRIDGLAERGVLIEKMFAAVPICCASRATMMTGRYPQSHGLMDLFFRPFEWSLHDDEQHLSQILRGAGYHNLLFGMQHEVGELNRLAFDEVPRARRQPCDAVAAEVADFFKDHAEDNEPFYAQIGFFETHSPFTWGGAVPDDSKGVHVPPWLVPSEPILRMLREFQGMLKKADAAVGVILDALRDSGLEENTILVVTTDHGIEFPRAKWHVYDPGIEIGMIFHWPAGGIAGGHTCDWLQSNVDFLPTLLELAGIPVHGRVQGKSFAKGLRKQGQPVNSAIFGMYQKKSEPRYVRTDEYKLIRNFRVDRCYRKPVDMTNPADYSVTPVVELYDLRADPLEFNNLADSPEHAEIRRDLEHRLFSWLESVDDPILRGPVRTPFYEKSALAYADWKKASASE